MISKMSDETALEMLMTSEFDDTFSPAEYKEMLLRYRYFYRILYSRYERQKSDSEFEIAKMAERISICEEKIFNLQVESVKKDEKIKNMRNRKLNLKERLTGKIIDSDED